MKFESKFNFGDVVYRNRQSQETKWEVCGFCDGEKIVTGKNNETRQCPECYNRGGSNVYLDKKWRVASTITIGEIRIKSRAKHESDYDSDFTNYGDQEAMYEEEYMCYETGIGSGTLWHVDKLFKTEADAQMECDKLNKKGGIK